MFKTDNKNIFIGTYYVNPKIRAKLEALGYATNLQARCILPILLINNDLGGFVRLILLRAPTFDCVDACAISVETSSHLDISIDPAAAVWSYKGVTRALGESIDTSDPLRDNIVGVYDLDSETQLNSMLRDAADIMNNQFAGVCRW